MHVRIRVPRKYTYFAENGCTAIRRAELSALSAGWRHLHQVASFYLTVSFAPIYVYNQFLVSPLVSPFSSPPGFYTLFPSLLAPPPLIPSYARFFLLYLAPPFQLRRGSSSRSFSIHPRAPFFLPPSYSPSTRLLSSLRRTPLPFRRSSSALRLKFRTALESRRFSSISGTAVCRRGERGVDGTRRVLFF